MKSTKQITRPYLEELETANYKGIDSDDFRLYNKWKNRIPVGWYGFDGINVLWGRVIDDFLMELEKVAPNFEIHQIKLKFGGLRFYVATNIKDVKLYNKVGKEIDKLENVLSSADLVY
jgi:hypothetical protein